MYTKGQVEFKGSLFIKPIIVYIVYYLIYIEPLCKLATIRKPNSAST